jgi:hypothetical protein
MSRVRQPFHQPAAGGTFYDWPINHTTEEPVRPRAQLRAHRPDRRASASCASRATTTPLTFKMSRHDPARHADTAFIGWYELAAPTRSTSATGPALEYEVLIVPTSPRVRVDWNPRDPEHARPHHPLDDDLEVLASSPARGRGPPDGLGS